MLETVVPMSKVLVFEYVLDSLVIWHERSVGTKETNDLSILKSLKLLFFVSAASVETNRGKSLLNIFNYTAMPFGHVESEIYDHIKTSGGSLNYFLIDNICTMRRTGTDINELYNAVEPFKKIVDTSVQYLSTHYPSLIKLSAFELVTLSHNWRSWKINYTRARSNAKKSHFIPHNEIVNEEKIFRLQTF